MYKKLLQHILTLKAGTIVSANHLAAQCEGCKPGVDLQAALRKLCTDEHLVRLSGSGQYAVV